MSSLFATTALVTAAGMVVVWLLSLVKRDASIVDIAWGLGFVLIGWTSFFVTGEPTAREWLLTALVSIWGLRLAGYLAWRARGRGEDFRYANMRRSQGRFFPILSLVTVFGLQGAAMWIVSLPLQIGQLPGDASLGVLDALGVALFLAGLFFEAIGDWQLARFKADPANEGRVMQTGLWRYTRHPNYFGDCLAWWGLFAIAASAPIGLASAIGPAVMTFLLLRVSGVALLERSLSARREGYADYMARTSAFFPRRPRGI